MSQFESISKHSGAQNYGASEALRLGIDSQAVELVSFPRPPHETAVLSGLTIPTAEASIAAAVSGAQPKRAEFVEARPTSKLLSPSYLLRDLREAVESAAKTVDSFCARLGISSVGKALVATSTAGGIAAAFVSVPVAAAGVTAIALWQMGALYQKNRHSRAVSLLASSLYTSHMAAMGFQSAAICSFAATSRSIVQAMVADDRPLARTVVAAGLFGATTVAHTLISNEYPRISVDNIPLITLALSSVAGAFSERFSWASRLTTLAGASLALGYHTTVTHSAVACWANAMLLPGLLMSIWKYDIARTGQNQR